MAHHADMAFLPLLAILAAGRATRFGADKLAAPLAGKPLALHALTAAHGTGLPLVWIGPVVRPGYLTPEVEHLANPDAADGLASSVALAARVARDRGYPALLLHLADMPCVPAALLRQLAQTPAPAACIHPDGRAGVPALIPAELYPALIALKGDKGAGPLLAARPDLTRLTPDPAQLLDVDTPAALAQAERYLTA